MAQLLDILDSSNNIIDVSNTFYIGTKQQPYNFYILNNAYYNFVFECTPLDVSSNYNIIPRFIDYFSPSSLLGFEDVSATATIDISDSMLNNIFMFQQRSLEALNQVSGLDELVYGINKSFFDITFTNAKVKRIYNGDISMVSLADDYIESLAERITNSTSTSPQNIIANVQQLKKGLEALDYGFSTRLNQRTTTYYDASLNTKDRTGALKPILNSFKTANIMDIACKNLIAGLLNFTTQTRINQFLDDMKIQENINIANNNPILYSFVFHSNDVVAIKIKYIPQFTIFNLDNNLVSFPPRTYKVFLKVI
jgi:hypothetical protein